MTDYEKYEINEILILKVVANLSKDEWCLVVESRTRISTNSRLFS